MFDNLGLPNNERRNVKILDTSAFDVKAPDEVPVYGSASNGGEIGRAILRVKKDAVYADIVLSKGTMEGQTAQAIGHKYPHVFEISGVGLLDKVE
ncbi:hypothetical protein LCGC14_0944320 [marine sediment metagenome]|uniref:Uncharacterized protein n=1 Tax=marine sediment metagenome TaxID=412755 RepID=A0A0F9NJ44_9ZZZZ